LTWRRSVVQIRLGPPMVFIYPPSLNLFSERHIRYLRASVGTDFDPGGTIHTVLTPIEIAFFSIDEPFVGTGIIGSAGCDEAGIIIY
jgi:hypothetical protein